LTRDAPRWRRCAR